MGWWGWEREASRPRRPAQGIKAQTQSGKFGKTWWAGRWIAALEQLVDSARLARGRSYARSGQVVSLDVGRSGVSARVQGSRPKPYQVTMTFKVLSDAEWDKVTDAMAAQALYAARLLNGEMPEQIEEVFAAAGTTLFPARRGDLTTECSCPDYANPCKHVAAVHYLLGERFDADPFLIFELRGRSKEEIATALRARRAGGEATTEAAMATQQDEEEEVAPLLGTEPDAFWSAPASVLELTTTFAAPDVDAVPVKRLGAPAFWRSRRDFTAAMEETYQAIGDYARHVALGEE
jgi:uncharacterized Zn finger protein